MDGVEVACLCDIVEEKARDLAEKFGVPATTHDYRELVANPDMDAVSVCTDHASHAEISIAALNAGKHVLCEKALAESRRNLDRMQESAAQAPSLVAAGIFQHHFTPINCVLKRWMDSGRLGQPLTAGVQLRCLRTPEYYAGDAWRGTWQGEGGSVMMNQAIHFVDLLAWLCGDVRAICGWHDNLTHGDTMETEDTAAAVLRFRNGALGTIEATCSSHLNWEFTISIHTSRASVEIRNDKPVKVECESASLAESLRTDLEGTSEEVREEVSKSHYGYGHPAQIRDFVEAIREQRAPAVSFHQARHAVDIALSLYDSCRTGRWAMLPDGYENSGPEDECQSNTSQPHNPRVTCHDV